MNILLVEPDRLLARVYKQVLTKHDHKVQVAPTAQLAVHAADKEQPDLVILEMQLVSHSGIEFLYEFRSYPEWQHIPVLVLSLVPPGEFINSWNLLQTELGVQTYLYKPHTSLARLARVVNEFATVNV